MIPLSEYDLMSYIGASYYSRLEKISDVDVSVNDRRVFHAMYSALLGTFMEAKKRPAGEEFSPFKFLTEKANRKKGKARGENKIVNYGFKGVIPSFKQGDFCIAFLNPELSHYSSN